MDDPRSVDQLVAAALAFLNPVPVSSASFDDQWYFDEAVDVLKRVPASPTAREVRTAIDLVFAERWHADWKASLHDPAFQDRLTSTAEHLSLLLSRRRSS